MRISSIILFHHVKEHIDVKIESMIWLKTVELNWSDHKYYRRHIDSIMIYLTLLENLNLKSCKVNIQ